MHGKRVYIRKVFGAVDNGDQRANDRPVNGHVGEDGRRMVDCPRCHGAAGASGAVLSCESRVSEGSVGGAEVPPDRVSVKVHALRSRRIRRE
jgi:hypothetical protein